MHTYDWRKRVRRHICVGRDKPGMSWPALEHELSASAPTRLQVDEGTNLLRQSKQLNEQHN